MPELERDYGVASLALFGSYVRGEEIEGSDLDILVDFNLIPSLLDLASLQRNLSDHLRTPIDLVPMSSLRETISGRILREAVEV